MNKLEMWFVVIFLVAAAAYWRAYLRTGFQLIFLLRFPLLLLLFPLLMIALLHMIKVEGEYNNLVILDSKRAEYDAFWISWVGFASAYMSLALMTVVLDHAGERFGVDFKVPPWFWTWKGIISFSVPPLGLMGYLYYNSPRPVFMGLVFGVLAACVGVLLVALMFHWLEPPTARDRNFILPNVFGDKVKKVDPIKMIAGRLLAHSAEAPANSASEKSSPQSDRDSASSTDPLTDQKKTFNNRLGTGYVRDNYRPYSEHIVIMVAVILALAVYLLSFYSGMWRLSHGFGTTNIPTLAYLEFLILGLALVFSAISFWLDRYRISAVVALIVYTLCVSTLFSTDHDWLAFPPASTAKSQVNQKSTFPDGIEEWLSKYSGENSSQVLRVDGKPILVVVCASGGGIEAAAWTTKVLTGLQRKFGKPFTRSIRLISSTSGGSVGSLFFVESFLEAKDVPTDLQRIVDAAETPSLDATGWGLVHPDFVRLLAPWLPLFGKHRREVDRAWALEQALRVALKGAKGGSIDSRLSEWRKAVDEGWLPGTVFNATLVESGNPLLFSTLHMPLPADSKTMVFGETDDSGADIFVRTAARLSASFPYMSPATRGRYYGADRKDRPARGMHVADGGYYDNYGITVAVEWLNDIIKRYSGTFGKVIIVEIDAFRDRTEPSESMGEWTSEFIGPIKSLLNARTSTQLGRDLIEIDLLKNLNSTFDVKPKSATPCPHLINSFRFTADHNGPLSWQLSDREKAYVDQDWTKAEQHQVKALGQCLGLN